MSAVEAVKRPPAAVEEDDDDVGPPMPPPGDDDDNDDDIGPPMPAPAKKRKVLEFESVYLKALPDCDNYETSYMHRATILFTVVTETDFLITASADGHIKFWKKKDLGIEFVKHFRAHIGPVGCIASSSNGNVLASVGPEDKILKVFDVVNFDVINMISLSFVPGVCEWLHSSGDGVYRVAVSDAETKSIYIYDGHDDGTVLHTVNCHSKPVTAMKFNPTFKTMISCGVDGMIEYWNTDTFVFPKSDVEFQSKFKTDLYCLVKDKTRGVSISLAPNGSMFCVRTMDRKVRVFRFSTGKLYRVYDDAPQDISTLDVGNQRIDHLELGRRTAVEKEIEKASGFQNSNIIFDESGFFIAFATMLGIKMINLKTNRVSVVIGRLETARFLHLSLHQRDVNSHKHNKTIDMATTDNPALKDTAGKDPTIFATAFRKNRFYMFTTRNPPEAQGDDSRDVFNEKPSREEIEVAAQTVVKYLSDKCTIHTTFGDVVCELYPKMCPRTVENFCTHARQEYYNGVIFHRVIKGFMAQTGDPLGNGTGGESIWGGTFEDEFHRNLRHDRPFTISMANAGENTNGSQFFITLQPTPWLDNKHTVFGRVVRGMDVVQKIGKVSVDKNDKPHDDVKIINISTRQ